MSHSQNISIEKYRLKKVLKSMQMRQRKIQNNYEESLRNLGNFVDAFGNPRQENYCKTCQLIHHDATSIHEESEMHQRIEKFRFRQCKFCNKNFKIPLQRVLHISSIEHHLNVSSFTFSIVELYLISFS